MKINRHNYEEFFLLYVDHELSATERKAVDLFVQENPDLQGELLSLHRVVLKADDIVLEKKDWLYMKEGITTLQENLLLYADNELTAADKKSVEILLATDKSAMAEWQILQQTKLETDTTVLFADKQSLYRKEVGRVVGFTSRRVAAAAVLLGFGLWTGVALFKNNPVATGIKNKAGNGVIAKQGKTVSGQRKKKTPLNTNTVEVQPAEIMSPKNTTAIAIQDHTTDHPDEKNKQPGIKSSKQNKVEVKDNIVLQKNNKKPGNNLPKPYFENINRKESNELVSTTVLPEKNNNSKGSGIDNVIVKTNPNEKITNPAVAGLNKSNTDPTSATAIPAVYIADESNNNRFLYMDEEKVKRTMLGGLLRKAKRMVERTTNIKTGDGLKVAGFEIALK